MFFSLLIDQPSYVFVIHRISVLHGLGHGQSVATGLQLRDAESSVVPLLNFQQRICDSNSLLVLSVSHILYLL